MVMIEALACGTPVVAYRRATAPEIVDHGLTGYLCDGIDGIAQGLIDAPGLDRAQCREAVAQRFTTHRMVAEHLALFERVVHETRGAASTPTPIDGTRVNGEARRRIAAEMIPLAGG
jgi:glycosyltransferase involved in cell wall biosynthesis